MKFPRNAKIFRGHLDATPFAGVFFCLLIFILLGSLIYTPGVSIHLPQSTASMQGVSGPAIAVAVDPNGQFYFQNQIIQGSNLLLRLQAEAARQKDPLTLVVQADRDVTQDQLNHLYDLAARAGIRQIQQAVLPRALDSRVP